MILGIGTDFVEISRFETWYLYSKKQVCKVFSESEFIQYQNFLAKGLQHQAATFLASRYAAKEAFYKALCAAHVTLCGTSFPHGFICIAQHIEIVSDGTSVPRVKGFENLFLAWYKKSVLVHLSFSHEKHNTLAFVIIV